MVDNVNALPPEDDSAELEAAAAAEAAEAAPAPAPAPKKAAPKAAKPDTAAFDAAVAAGVAAALAAQAAAAPAEIPVIEIIPANARVTIVVEENDNIPPTGIFIGVNGRSFLIRPGENVDVPIEVVEALNDAVESTPKTDQQGNVIEYRNRLRFPYRIVSK